MTIVIMLGIVLMWAVVLIPMWLRRHDEVEESRSLDRFSTAMHTLSRREPESADKKYLVMPHRTRSLDVHVSGGAISGGTRPGRSATEIRAAKLADRAARSGPVSQAAAARRRRTLTMLVLAAIVTLVAWFAVGGVLVLGVQLLSDVALVGFVWSLRGSSAGSSLAVEPRRRPAAAPARAARPAQSARQSTRPVRRAESVYDDDTRDLYDDVDWHVPVPPRRETARTVPVRQASELFDQSALDDGAADGTHDVWLEAPTYDETAPHATPRRRTENPQYFDLPRAEPVRERVAEHVERRERHAAPTRPQAPPQRPAARIETPAEKPRGRRTVDSRRSSVSDRIASYARDLEVDVVRPSRAPKPAADASIGARPWEPVPVPRPVYTTKPTAPRRTARAPMPPPPPAVTEPVAADLPAEDLEEILDRRWAVND